MDVIWTAEAILEATSRRTCLPLSRLSKWFRPNPDWAPFFEHVIGDDEDEAATAPMAFFGPRLERMRRYWA